MNYNNNNNNINYINNNNNINYINNNNNNINYINNNNNINNINNNNIIIIYIININIIKIIIILKNLSGIIICRLHTEKSVCNSSLHTEFNSCFMAPKLHTNIIRNIDFTYRF